MITLKTERAGQRNRYVRVDTDHKGREILHRESQFFVIETFKGGKTQFSLLDEDGHTNADFHKYINGKMFDDGRSPNSRRKSAHVLCKFYSYLDLMCYSIYNLGYDELQKLCVFLQGTGRTQCSNKTVNAYLGVIREYFRCLGIQNSVLFDRRVTTATEKLENDFKVENVYYTYKLNLAVNPHAQRVPKYISMDNYIRLIEIARKKGDWTGIILMHLMFRYGMRLGECLGLTEEDYIMMRIKGNVVPTLILRNRLSDAPDQKAKRRLTPRSRSDYEGQPYIQQWRNDDYSHINLTESEDTEFVRVFEKFMRDTRERAEALYPNNYRTCEADIVVPADFKGKGLQKNHYIFVNHLGKRLSAQFWGKRLKEYFIEAGIPLDKGKKVNNLSHRFRHGFAMMHARFMDPLVPATELQKMMRHRNLSSTMIYYNPTQEDEYDYKTKMQNKFYDNNEELNGILAGFLSEN